jgi:hypothetical protein
MRLPAWLLVIGACSSALNEPAPVSSFAQNHNNHNRTPAELIHDADAAWARRGEPGQAGTAQALYLQAANADEHDATSLIGAMRAITFRIEHERGVPKADFAKEGVQLGQWCQRRAPTNPECDYRLAIALGQQAREMPSTGMDAIGKMVDLLTRTIAAAPRLDSAGPHRVLALIYLRAPSWPVGPGDADLGLREARAAVAAFPDAPQNQLALGEALLATGARDQALAAYRRAFATASTAHGDPEAADYVAQARTGIEHAEAH